MLAHLPEISDLYQTTFIFNTGGHGCMKDFIDLHTHTIASGHAYNTMNEMIAAAAAKGLSIIGITEHGPAVKESCRVEYFMNYKSLPRTKMGITTLFGVELNIVDLNGQIDIPEKLLPRMDLTILSMHNDCIKSGTADENTRAYLNAMKNEYVNIVGHPDDSRFQVRYKELVKGAKEYHVLLEVNNNSFSPTTNRQNARDNYREMLAYCMEYKVPVIVNSDAHVDTKVGNHELAMQLLKEIDFPKELIANNNLEILKDYLNYYK